MALEEAAKNASSSVSLTQSIPSVLLESSNTPELQSDGDGEDGDGNANGKIYM